MSSSSSSSGGATGAMAAGGAMVEVVPEVLKGAADLKRFAHLIELKPYLKKNSFGGQFLEWVMRLPNGTMRNQVTIELSNALSQFGPSAFDKQGDDGAAPQKGKGAGKPETKMAAAAAQAANGAAGAGGAAGGATAASGGEEDKEEKKQDLSIAFPLNENPEVKEICELLDDILVRELQRIWVQAGLGKTQPSLEMVRFGIMTAAREPKNADSAAQYGASFKVKLRSDTTYWQQDFTRILDPKPLFNQRLKGHYSVQFVLDKVSKIATAYCTVCRGKALITAKAQVESGCPFAPKTPAVATTTTTTGGCIDSSSSSSSSSGDSVSGHKHARDEESIDDQGPAKQARTA